MPVSYTHLDVYKRQAEGTPEEVMANPSSYTGQSLRKVLPLPADKTRKKLSKGKAAVGDGNIRGVSESEK